MERPQVENYVDYRAYLGAFWQWKKQSSGQEFSYAIFSEKAGFRSRSFARLVMQGKRKLSTEAIAKFSKALGLTNGEAKAFQILVSFNQATDFETRKIYWEQFLALRSQKVSSRTAESPGYKSEVTVLSNAYLYLARFSYPLLLTLIRQSHISQKIADLSLMTGLKQKEVQEGLDTLLQLGAIQKAEDGHFRATAMGFTSPHDLPNIAVQTFHRNMADRTKEAATLPPQQREFQSLFLPLDEAALIKLKNRIREFVEDIRVEFGGVQPTSTKVFGFNINSIPLTPELIRAQGPSQSLDQKQPSGGILEKEENRV